MCGGMVSVFMFMRYKQPIWMSNAIVVKSSQIKNNIIF